MIKGKTSTGFEYKISKARLENYELMELLGELENNSLVLPRVVISLLGKEQTEKLKEHLREKDGTVSTEKMTNELQDIFESQQDLKN